jgi:uncharacterized protein YdeI (YjbR/CyaY-like superfamily)
MSDSFSLAFRDGEGWRRWLEENHVREKEAWVTIQKARSPYPGVTYEEALDEAMCFGWIDGKMRTIDKNSFTLRFSPRRRNSVWSLSNVERAERLIGTGRMAEAGYEAVEEAKRNCRWDSAYTSRVSPQVPRDLEEALKANEEALANFKMFSNSVKLMYVHWVEQAKMEGTRARRISEVVARAAKNIKPT